MTRRGFSLFELLMVLLIIALLAAILFPVIARTKASAKLTPAISNLRQLGVAAGEYAEGSDGAMVPSTGYGVKNHAWPDGLQPFAKSRLLYIAPDSKGTEGRTESEWAAMTVGMNLSTATDPAGCEPDAKDRAGCRAFQGALVVSKVEGGASAALFSTTPGGPAEKGYAGWEISPFNDETGTRPIISDHDVVIALGAAGADLLRPVLAPYGSDGKNHGRAPLVFLDGHAKAFSARALSSDASGVVWDLRR